ncbi:hypothetical protein [Roseateles chitinivorans]|uniref:hypothetical protein n=1 Tax=Roseateles chitinivorans TaxID=2917965 RepID=UPI003D67D08D
MQLLDTRIVLNSTGETTVRWNGIAGSKSKEAQITVVSGSHTIEGNVLWRARGEPGFGIDVGRIKDIGHHAADLPASASKVLIAGNFIGAAHPSRNDHPHRGSRPGQPSLLTMFNAMLDGDPEAYMDEGHYLAALRTHAPVSTEIVDNLVVLNAPDADRDAFAQRRAAGTFSSARHLKFINNTVLAEGFAGDQRPPLRLRSPSDVEVHSNVLDQVPLILDKDPRQASLTKRTSIWDNWIGNAFLSIRVPVNGSGNDQTGPGDVEVLANSFIDPDRCPIRLHPPEAGTSNYKLVSNRAHGKSGSTRDPEPCTRAPHPGSGLL